MPRLSKEASRAVAKFKEEFLSFSTEKLQEELNLSTGACVINFSGWSKKITISNGPNWRWNRSVSIENIHVSPSLKISLDKLNSRAISRGTSFPTYKIWIATVRQATQTPLYFVWCEKGEFLLLQDLAFLKPFVSPDVAADFNW